MQLTLKNSVYEISNNFLYQRGNNSENIYSTSLEGYGGTVVWAGDLDGDGKLDLFLSQDCRGVEDAKMCYGLFLSSYAKGDKLVQWVGKSEHWEDSGLR